MLKLNLGCGYKRRDGFVNVDVSSACSPDLTANLEEFPWPWETDSVDHVVFNHSLEHMCAATHQFLELMKELYRICANDALVEIRVPHPRHDDFINDPSHVRVVTPALLTLFNRQKNDEWKAMGASNTPFAHYLNVDFEVQKADMILDEPYRSRFMKREISLEQLEMDARSKTNVVKEFSILMRARKSAPHTT